MKGFFQFSLLLVLASAARALEFTPVEVIENGEGGVSRYLRFADPVHPVTYQPPRGWDYRGGGQVFTLLPKDLAGVEVDISTRCFERPLAVEAENAKDFAQQTVELLPQGASNVQILSSDYNPIEISGKKTVGVTLTYGFFGQTLKASYLYLARDMAPVRFRAGPLRAGLAPPAKSMLLFRVVTRPADFDKVSKAFHYSLNSLAGL